MRAMQLKAEMLNPVMDDIDLPGTQSRPADSLVSHGPRKNWRALAACLRLIHQFQSGALAKTTPYCSPIVRQLRMGNLVVKIRKASNNSSAKVNKAKEREKRHACWNRY